MKRLIAIAVLIFIATGTIWATCGNVRCPYDGQQMFMTGGISYANGHYWHEYADREHQIWVRCD